MNDWNTKCDGKAVLPMSIPEEVFNAAVKVCKWFDEQNVKEWSLYKMQNRIPSDYVSIPAADLDEVIDSIDCYATDRYRADDFDGMKKLCGLRDRLRAARGGKEGE